MDVTERAEPRRSDNVMPVADNVNEVVDAIKKVSKPDAVILFGSMSKESKGNDIDLLIVGSRRDEKRVRTSLYPLYKKYPVDAFFVTKKKLTELYYSGSPFFASYST